MSQKTRAALAAEFAANLPDNTTGAITPAILRTTLGDLLDSIPTFLDNPSLQWVAVPASSGAAGTAGQAAYDGNYYYVCVANATWIRAPLSDWS